MAIAGNNFLIMAVLVFVALLLLFESLYLLWMGEHGPQARRLRHRMRVLSDQPDPEVRSRLLKERPGDGQGALNRLARAVPHLRGLERHIMQSGLAWTVPKVLAACAACAVLAWMLVVGLAHQAPLTGLIVAAVCAFAPIAVVDAARRGRLQRIERQLPDALDLIARGLKAGHAFSAALKMAGEELPEPIGLEFRSTHDEINFGVSMQEALTHLGERVPTTDMRYFVVAVLIQRESGGNLTEILGNLSHLVRERLKLLARVRVLSSEGRMSAWILALLPFALAALMNAFNPKFMSPLWTDPIGIAIVKYMLGLMAVGVLILRRVIRIHV